MPGPGRVWLPEREKDAPSHQIGDQSTGIAQYMQFAKPLQIQIVNICLQRQVAPYLAPVAACRRRLGDGLRHFAAGGRFSASARQTTSYL
jgi:hypothetical protein